MFSVLVAVAFPVILRVGVLPLVPARRVVVPRRAAASPRWTTSSARTRRPTGPPSRSSPTGCCGSWSASRTYLPYQALVVAAHLAVAVLLRQLMRRAGVDPWVATIAAAPFIFFGPGDQNIVWAFQIGFTGSIVLRAHPAPPRHPRRPDRPARLAGLGAGLLALMCSGVGVTMAVIVGVATLLLRGWRVAAFHTVPLAAAYGLWTLIEHPVTGAPGFGRPSLRGPGRVGRQLRAGHVRGARALPGRRPADGGRAGRRPRPRVAGGARRAAGDPRRAPRRARGLLADRRAGAVAVRSRVRQGESLPLPRRAFTVPALGVAVDALRKRWRFLWPALIVLLLVPVPANHPRVRQRLRVQRPVLRRGAAHPHHRGAHALRPTGPLGRAPHPRRLPLEDPDIGFLLDAKRRPAATRRRSRCAEAGQRDEGPARRGAAAQRRSLGALRHADGPALELRPEKGTTFELTTPVQIETIDDAGRPTSKKLTFRPVDGNELTIELPDLALRVDALRGQTGFGLCEG